MVSVTSSIDLKQFKGFMDQLQREADLVVRKTAFKIEADAKTLTPVDTGALRASIYTVTAKQTGYSSAISRSRALRPMFKNDPEIKNTAPLTAYVAVGAEYGKFVEYGTRRSPARPFMSPAAMAGREFFMKEMQAAIRRSSR